MIRSHRYTSETREYAIFLITSIYRGRPDRLMIVDRDDREVRFCDAPEDVQQAYIRLSAWRQARHGVLCRCRESLGTYGQGAGTMTLEIVEVRHNGSDQGVYASTNRKMAFSSDEDYVMTTWDWVAMQGRFEFVYTHGPNVAHVELRRDGQVIERYAPKVA